MPYPLLDFAIQDVVKSAIMQKPGRERPTDVGRARLIGTGKPSFAVAR